jgi:tetratricopeptide (TPR) repeat protein
MHALKLVFASAVLALSAGAALASDAAVVADPPGWADGDADAMLDALVGVVERDREGPLGQAALVATRGLWDDSRDAAPYVKRLEAALAAGGRAGDTDEMIRRTLGDRYLETGDDAKRLAVGMDAGYLSEFLVCGPFGTSASAAVDAPYPPETALDVEKAMAGRTGPVRWMRYRSLGVGELVEPFEYLRPTDGVAYALAQVRSEKERAAVLKVTCRASHKVLVNGAEVLRVDRLREAPGRTTWTPVTLAAGWNRVLVKVVGSPGLMVKVCDASTGLPLDGLEVEKGVLLHPASPALPAPAKVGYVSNLRRLLAAEPAGPAERTVRGIMCEFYDLDWPAYTDLERAAKEAPGSAGTVLRFAQFVQSFGEMPEPRWRKNRARALYEDVLERSPCHAEAVIALAHILDGEDRTEEAIAGLKELPPPPKEGSLTPEAAKSAAETRAAMERSRKVFPGLDALVDRLPKLAWARYVRSELCQNRSWWKEAQEAAEKSLEANPRCVRALSYLLRVAENFNNTPKAEETCRRILALDASDTRVSRRLAGILRSRGDDAGALKILEAVVARFPSDFSVREERAQHLAALDRVDDAVAALRDMAEISPLEESYPRRIGELLRKKGDDAGAAAAWQKSLDLAPGQGVLRRELARLKGADLDFFKKYDVDGLAMAKEAGGQDKYPKAVAVHVLDLSIMRVNRDGSSTSYTHDVWKILNEKGREKYSDINVPARPQDILEVRAVSPDGQVYLPIGARGSSFTLEGLQGGWIVEYSFIRDQPRTDRGFDSGGWYFQDPDIGGEADPVVLSRYVVDMPEEMDPPLLLRNYGPKPQPVVENGRRVWTFEKKDQDRIESEPRMPGADEICPWTRFYAPWKWEDINLEAQDAVEGLKPTPILEEKAREVAGGAEGPLAKAKALYAFVNREITGNAGGWGPTGVLLEKSGNRFGLFGALLRSAGVPFDVVKVCTSSPDSVLWEVPEPDFFDSTGYVVRGDDPSSMADDAFVFPFARHTPFGRIPSSCRGQPALLPGRAGATLFRMPEGSDADLEEATSTTVTLGAAAGDTTFSLRVIDPSDGRYGYKERVKDMNEDERKKQTAQMLGRFLETADMKTYAYPTLESYGEPWVLEASGALPRLVKQEGGESVVPLPLQPLHLMDEYIQKPDRSWPFVIRDRGSREVRRDEVVFDLGGRWRVKSLPGGHTAATKLGTYSLTVSPEGGKIRVVRTVRLGDCRYTPDEYRELVTWCREIDAAEEQRLVLEEAR